MSEINLIGLVELARERNLSPDRLETQLRAFEESEPHLRGMILVHVGHRKKKWVNRAVLEHLNTAGVRELKREVNKLRAHVKQLEHRITVLELPQCG